MEISTHFSTKRFGTQNICLIIFDVTKSQMIQTLKMSNEASICNHSLCRCPGEQKASLGFIYKKYTWFIFQTRPLKFTILAHSQNWCQLFKQRRLKPSWTHQSFLCREKQEKSRACIFLLDWEQWFLCFFFFIWEICVWEGIFNMFV